MQIGFLLLTVLSYTFPILSFCNYSAFTFNTGFPGSSDGKVSAYNAGDLGSIPGSGRSPGDGNGNTLQYSPGKSRGLVGYSPWGHKELDTTEQLHFTLPLIHLLTFVLILTILQGSLEFPHHSRLCWYLLNWTSNVLNSLGSELCATFWPLLCLCFAFLNFMFDFSTRL